MKLQGLLLALLLSDTRPLGGGGLQGAEADVTARKILLTSTGLSTPELRSHFTRLLLKASASPDRAHVTYIADAAVGERRNFANICAQRTGELKDLGAATVDCLALRDTPPDELRWRLDGVSAIYADYGNTFYLMYYMRHSGFAAMLPTLVEQGVLYVGSSASSICAGTTIDVAFWKGWDDPGHNKEWDLRRTKEKYMGLDLLRGVSFFPHYSEEWASLVERKSADLDHKLVVLDDSSAYLVEGQHQRLLGPGANKRAGNLELR